MAWVTGHLLTTTASFLGLIQRLVARLVFDLQGCWTGRLRAGDDTLITLHVVQTQAMVLDEQMPSRWGTPSKRHSVGVGERVEADASLEDG
jgi:hypothetical protein